jgi:hypothetical protein
MHLLFEKITIFVFDAFTDNFQVSQYKNMAFNAACNSTADSAKITVSSAYNKIYSLKKTSISSLSNNKCEIVPLHRN